MGASCLVTCICHGDNIYLSAKGCQIIFHYQGDRNVPFDLWPKQPTMGIVHRSAGAAFRTQAGLNGAKGLMATVPVSDKVTAEFQVNAAPADFRQSLPEGFLEFLAPFHTRCASRQSILLEDRRRALEDSLASAMPAHHYPGPAVRNGWRLELPDWCQDQRNQMTGPADDAGLVVKMLNSGAPGVMLDLEASTVNAWEHQRPG